MSDVLDNSVPALLKEILKVLKENQTIMLNQMSDAQTGYTKTPEFKDPTTNRKRSFMKQNPKILCLTPSLMFYDIVGCTDDIEFFRSASAITKREFESLLLYLTVELSKSEIDVNNEYVFLFTLNNVPSTNPNIVSVDVVFVPSGLQNLTEDIKKSNTVYSFDVECLLWEKYLKLGDYTIVRTLPIITANRNIPLNPFNRFGLNSFVKNSSILDRY